MGYSQDLVVIQTVVSLGGHVDINVLWLSVQVFLGEAQLRVDILLTIVVVVDCDLNKVDNVIVVKALIGWGVESRLGEVHLRLKLEQNNIIVMTIVGPAEWISPSAEFWLHGGQVLWVVPLSVHGRVIVKLAKIGGHLPLKLAISLHETLSAWSSISWVHSGKTIWLLILKVELKVMWECIDWLWGIWVVLWGNPCWLNSSLELLVMDQFRLG